MAYRNYDRADENEPEEALKNPPLASTPMIGRRPPVNAMMVHHRLKIPEKIAIIAAATLTVPCPICSTLDMFKYFPRI